jgi:hypothetical protein
MKDLRLMSVERRPGQKVYALNPTRRFYKVPPSVYDYAGAHIQAMIGSLRVEAHRRPLPHPSLLPLTLRRLTLE